MDGDRRCVQNVRRFRVGPSNGSQDYRKLVFENLALWEALRDADVGGTGGKELAFILGRLSVAISQVEFTLGTV